MLSLWVIRRSLHINKIHKNKIHSYNFRSRRKENNSEIPAHGIYTIYLFSFRPPAHNTIYRREKLFLQPIKLREISIMVKSFSHLSGLPSVESLASCLILDVDIKFRPQTLGPRHFDDGNHDYCIKLREKELYFRKIKLPWLFRG